MTSDISLISEQIASVSEMVGRIKEQMRRVLVGQDELVDGLLIGLLANGHVLLEGVPGLAKTLSVRALASAVAADFKRIQFTPDLLPADLVGTMVYDQKSCEFLPRQGPVFCNLLLADEVNRAPAKVQSALLQCMQEQEVTLGKETFRLPEPFMVLATQNPIEYEGTFPLPEAQVDRFLLRVRLGYPSLEDEVRVLDRQQIRHPFETLQQVVQVEELLAVQEQVKQVFVSPALKRYIVELVNQTRQHGEVYLGASPRGSLALYRTAQARAAMHGREYVLPDDLKALAVPTLAHRVILGPGARLRDLTAEQVVEEILNTVPVPGGDPLGRAAVVPVASEA